MSYPPPPGHYPMYGAPPVHGGGPHYPPPVGPALGFDGYASQPPVCAPGVRKGFYNKYYLSANL